MRNSALARKLAFIRDILGVGPVVGVVAALLIAVALMVAVFWFVASAPPNELTMMGGPEGSAFQRNAEKYRAILARNGVKLTIVSSQGSLENLVHLADNSFHVDVGFVQAGLIKSKLAEGLKIDNLVSLGSVSYQPLWVFYRGKEEIDKLRQLAGKKLVIGQPGSGGHTLATELLKANGIETGGATELIASHPEEGAEALLDGKVDAVFLMSDSTPIELTRKLLRTPQIHLMSFAQAAAYTRRIDYLNKLLLPEGGIDFGQDIPAHDVSLIGPTVELVARKELHPALSDLLLEAAREVHGGAGLLRHRAEFPAPMGDEFQVSDDATRYYKSGKSFLYRTMPFWLASLVNRILVVLIPITVVLVPGLRLLPALYRWRIRSRIWQWYGALLELEGKLMVQLEPEQRAAMVRELDDIERAASRMRVPKSFGDQFYVLRQHIQLVRDRLLATPLAAR